MPISGPHLSPGSTRPCQDFVGSTSECGLGEGPPPPLASQSLPSDSRYKQKRHL